MRTTPWLERCDFGKPFSAFSLTAELAGLQAARPRHKRARLFPRRIGPGERCPTAVESLGLMAATWREIAACLAGDVPRFHSIPGALVFMNVILVGAGEIRLHIAERLSKEGQTEPFIAATDQDEMNLVACAG
jgi:hypothetical protein